MFYLILVMSFRYLKLRLDLRVIIIKVLFTLHLKTSKS